MVGTSSTRTRGGRTERLAETVPAPRRRRNVPLVLFGLLVTVGCALMFALTAMNVGERMPVLAVTRALPAGHVLTEADLAVVQADVPAPVNVVAAADRSSVIGRTTALPLSPRSLLHRQALGPAAFPAGDQVVLGMALKAGRYPPGLAAGVRAQAYRAFGEQLGAVNAPEADQAALPIGIGTVLQVDQGHEGDGVLVELQVPRDQAPQIAAAAAAGTVTLVLVGAGG